jgi:proteasome lid subunit RPN8/RPN11
MEGIMTLHIPQQIMNEIHAHGEGSYPEEGAGLLLGKLEDGERRIESILFLENAREDGARHNRYLITAEDMLRGEMEAEKQGLSIIGIFHSHPDHPNLPSEFDREYAIPWYSYLITSVNSGKAASSRSWRLEDDREGFLEEQIEILNV